MAHLGQGALGRQECVVQDAHERVVVERRSGAYGTAAELLLVQCNQRVGDARQDATAISVLLSSVDALDFGHDIHSFHLLGYAPPETREEAGELPGRVPLEFNVTRRTCASREGG